MMVSPFLFSLLLVLFAASSASASSGDRSTAYQSCEATCVSSNCRPENSSGRSKWDETASWTLKWSRWTCQDDCAYRCSQSLTDRALGIDRDEMRTEATGSKEEAAASGELNEYAKGGRMEGLASGRMVQFHGKWPLRRFLGIQEPLSVLFSLLNGLNHYRGLRSLRSSPSTRSPSSISGRLRSPSSRFGNLRSAYELNAWIGINLWFWSTVFHTRDRPWSEKGDYFSAAVAMMYGVYLFIVRSSGYYAEASTVTTTRDGSEGRWKAMRRWRILAISIVIAHVSYLTIWKFDYGYNMIFNSIIGIIQIAAWCAWALYYHFSPSKNHLSSASSVSSSRSQSRPPHYWAPVAPLLICLACSSLELFDFAPVPRPMRLLDAHALWHAGTIGVVAMWYRFLKTDVEWVEGRMLRL